MAKSRRYARGERAWGHDARTGDRVLLKDLVRDGHTGLPVTRESYEPRHPQEVPPDIFDPQVLRRPAPDLDRPGYTVSYPTGDWTKLWEFYRPLTLQFHMASIKPVVAQGLVTDGLLAEYRFDEGSGQVLTDYTSNGHDGQLGTSTGEDSDDPTWSDEGLTFDGTDDIVTCDTAGISGGTARTLIAVLNRNGGGEWSIEWPGDGNASTRFTCKVDGNTDELRFEFQVGGFSFDRLIVSENGWHFVAWSQSGANVNTAIAYLDGNAQVCTRNQTLNTSGNLTFGKNLSNFRSQKVAYCMVYNRALTPAEIAQNRDTLIARLSARGVVLPDEGIGEGGFSEGFDEGFG